VVIRFGVIPNQSLQQTVTPVTSLAGASAAPGAPAAEAGVRHPAALQAKSPPLVRMRRRGAQSQFASSRGVAMRPQIAVMAYLALAAWSLAFAQPVERPDSVSRTTILIKFRAAHMGEALAALPLAQGATLDSGRTGITAVDDLILKYGVPTISRPFPFGASDDGSSFVAKWFAFRFGAPIDVFALKASLELFEEVEEVGLEYRGWRCDAPLVPPNRAQ